MTIDRVNKFFDYIIIEEIIKVFVLVKIYRILLDFSFVAGYSPHHPQPGHNDRENRVFFFRHVVFKIHPASITSFLIIAWSK